MADLLDDVSIIIVTYQGDGLTKNCLDSLAASRRDKKRILAARRQANRIRKVTDSRIFKTVMKRPPLMDLLRYFKGNM